MIKPYEAWSKSFCKALSFIFVWNLLAAISSINRFHLIMRMRADYCRTMRAFKLNTARKILTARRPLLWRRDVALYPRNLAIQSCQLFLIVKRASGARQVWHQKSWISILYKSGIHMRSAQRTQMCNVTNRVNELRH